MDTAEISAGSEQGGNQSKLWLIVRTIISLALLIAILQHIEKAPVLQLILSARPGWLLAAAAVAFAGRLFAAFRWYILLRGRNAYVTFFRVTNIVFISSFLGMLLPGAIGVEVLRVYGMSKTTADTALAISSVLVERLLAIFILTLFSIAG
ncbi:MAG: lysylphosphatidylglycerol synthase transmembrane domain-containing protein, partial [Desulfobacterales bacterium]|nr:lysylphosphatidylglycerol synthase transmembrane domain-containing protein [Desulfobacterales bacterium]